MSELIAVAHPQLYLPTKRDALLFDRIGMLGFKNRQHEADTAVRAELEWLKEHGVVFETGMLVSTGDFPFEALPYAEQAFIQTTIAASIEVIAADPAMYEQLDSQSKLRKRLEKFPTLYRNVDVSAVARKAHYALESVVRQSSLDLSAAASIATEHAVQNAARFVAQLHRIIHGVDAIPIGPSAPVDLSPPLGKARAPVLSVVLEALPVPTDDTPWEQVIEFRNDDAARLALRRLRRWMRTIATETRSEAELRDELQSLLDDYMEYMRVHRMKTRRSLIEAIVTTAGEIAEDVIKFRFGKLANLLFSASAQRVTLLEAELAAPGREIAYISKAHDAFRQSGA